MEGLFPLSCRSALHPCSSADPCCWELRKAFTGSSPAKTGFLAQHLKFLIKKKLKSHLQWQLETDLHITSEPTLIDVACAPGAELQGAAHPHDPHRSLVLSLGLMRGWFTALSPSGQLASTFSLHIVCA